MVYYELENLVGKYFHSILVLLFNPAIYGMGFWFLVFLANTLKLKSLDVVPLIQSHTIQS